MLRRSVPLPFVRAPGLALVARAHDRQRQLVAQQLVIGQPHPRRREGRQFAFALRVMGGAQSLRPSFPLPLLEDRGIDPFRQLGQPLERRLDRFAQDLGRQAGGHGIDRLHDLDLGELFFRHDMVGMDHAELAAEAIDAAADRARLPERQGLQQIILARVEEHEVDEAGRVGAAHLVGLARVVRLHVPLDPHHDRGDGAALGGRQVRLVAPIDQAGGQVPDQVHDQRAGQLFHQLRQPLTDARQTGY